MATAGSVFFSYLALSLPTPACTNLIVTKGASANQSCSLTYTADSFGFFARLGILEASDGSARPEGGSLLIPEGTPTYKVFGFWGTGYFNGFQGIMNEHQVAIAETTYTGIEELKNSVGQLLYPELITMALQRSKTAREALDVMIAAVEEFGYIDVGESISICDKNEAWVFEIIGTGSTDPEQNRGAIWVAKRIPDGEISAHANQPRIRELVRNDPDQFRYSENVESFAIERGLYDPASGVPFSFADAYGDISLATRRLCEKRVWILFHRAAPSLNLPVDYAQAPEESQIIAEKAPSETVEKDQTQAAAEGTIAGQLENPTAPLPATSAEGATETASSNAAPYSWSIVPDHPLSTAEIMALMRDHFQDTPYDTTQGVAAGPFGNPIRNRPTQWKVDENSYSWERPISTQQTCLSVVTQSRSDLPDEIGGLVWLGWDDSYTTVYFPIYACLNRLPPSHISGSIEHFDPDNAWWTFNMVANYAYPRYSQMLGDIQPVQQELESQFLELQPVIEKTALELIATNPALAQTFLTDYSVMQAEKVVARWRELAHHLFVKYNDGAVRSPEGKYDKEGGYPEPWLRHVLDEKVVPFQYPPTPTP